MKTILLIKSVTILTLGLLSQESLEKQSKDVPFQIENSLRLQQEEPVYTTEVLLHEEVKPGCYTMQVSVYATYPNGQRLLKHSAMIQSGFGCDGNDAVLNSQTYSKKSGPEYVIHDDNLNGSIKDFIKDHEDVYQGLVSQKEKVMGIN